MSNTDLSQGKQGSQNNIEKPIPVETGRRTSGFDFPFDRSEE